MLNKRMKSLNKSCRELISENSYMNKVIKKQIQVSNIQLSIKTKKQNVSETRYYFKQNKNGDALSRRYLWWNINHLSGVIKLHNLPRHTPAASKVI